METPFDRRLRRLRRDRAAPRFEGANYLHRAAAEELLDRLDCVTRTFTQALILGCPDRFLSGALAGRGLEVVSADPGFAFARATAGVQCDEDRLPFADASFDLVMSVGLLDSVNDLPGALTLIRRALRPDGLFLAAFVGAGSLAMLRRAMLAADEVAGGAAPRVHPQIDVRAAGNLLARVGFALPVADLQTVEVRYSGLTSLVSDLRAMGGTNLLAGRAGPLPRAGYAAALAAFASAAEPDGKTVERFDIVHLLGWAPSPDQPKAARRGSASASLADALRPGITGGSTP
jgi:SAM-dependent methyltransferase